MPVGWTRMLDDKTLSQIEKKHAAGLRSVEILDLFARHGIRLTEATLRKYVQLGILPRSRRVGCKGKHKGSQGVYPVGVVRQIVRVRHMMAAHYTIEQIQKEFLFVRGDIEDLEQTLNTILETLTRVCGRRGRLGYGEVVEREIAEARTVARRLVEDLVKIEGRLTSPAEVKRVTAS